MAVCPFCREAIGERELYACPACRTPHHETCWRENRGCTVFGCQCAPPDEEKVSISGETARQPPPQQRGARYMLARNGQQFGPYTLEELQQFVAQQRASAADLVWTEGMPQWVALGQVLGPARGAAPPRPPAPPHYPTPGPGHAPAGYRSMAAMPHAQAMRKPDNYLISAVLVTLFCCLPFGITAIVYASQVDAKFGAGDYAGAQAASNMAQKWFYAGLIGGLISGLGIIVLNVLAATSR